MWDVNFPFIPLPAPPGIVRVDVTGKQQGGVTGEKSGIVGIVDNGEEGRVTPAFWE